MKRICKYCDRDLSLEQFEITGTVKGIAYRRRRCKDCKRKLKQARIIRLREWFQNYKENLSCTKCGSSDFRVLEFHHASGDKEHNVSDMITAGYSTERVQGEIKKCDVLCANCHRIVHWEQAKAAGSIPA